MRNTLTAKADHITGSGSGFHRNNFFAVEGFEHNLRSENCLSESDRKIVDQIVLMPIESTVRCNTNMNIEIAC